MEDLRVDPERDQPPETDPQATDAAVQRHGAGKGGRLVALLLVTAALGVGLLAVYWGVTR